MHNDQNPSFTHQCVVLSKKKMDPLLQYGSNFLHLKCEELKMFMHYIFKNWNVELEKSLTNSKKKC